jgi:hypothetical protein
VLVSGPKVPYRINQTSNAEFDAQEAPEAAQGSSPIERQTNGEIEILRHLGSSEWFIRTIPTLRSIIGRARRLFRVDASVYKLMGRAGSYFHGRGLTRKLHNRLRNWDYDVIVASWPESLSPGNEQRDYCFGGMRWL